MLKQILRYMCAWAEKQFLQLSIALLETDSHIILCIPRFCGVPQNFTASIYSSSLCIISIRNTLSLFQVSVTIVFVLEFVLHHCNMTLTKSFSGIHSFIIFSCWRQKASGLSKENSSRYPYHSLVITRTFYTVNSFGSLL